MKIIKINATWCSACLSMHKVWNQIIKTYPNIEIINYDYDLDEETVKKYNVGSILPVAIFYQDDKEIARLNGEKTKEEIEKIIRGC